MRAVMTNQQREQTYWFEITDAVAVPVNTWNRNAAMAVPDAVSISVRNDDRGGEPYVRVTAHGHRVLKSGGQGERVEIRTLHPRDERPEWVNALVAKAVAYFREAAEILPPIPAVWMDDTTQP